MSELTDKDYEMIKVFALAHAIRKKLKSKKKGKSIRSEKK